MITPTLSAAIITAQRAASPLDAALTELTKAHALGNVSRVGNAADDAITAIQDLLLELKDVRQQCDAAVDKQQRGIVAAVRGRAAA